MLTRYKDRPRFTPLTAALTRPQFPPSEVSMKCNHPILGKIEDRRPVPDPEGTGLQGTLLPLSCSRPKGDRPQGSAGMRAVSTHVVLLQIGGPHPPVSGLVSFFFFLNSVTFFPPVSYTIEKVNSAEILQGKRGCSS